jgi:hypothetical protein
VNGLQRIAVALGACVVIVVAPVASEARSTQNTWIVVQFKSVTVSERDHDVAPKGPSAGDWATERSVLYNASAWSGYPKGAKVGWDSGVARVTGPYSVTVRGTTHLPGGIVYFRGRMTSAGGPDTRVPVVGGTGRFAGAHGTLITTGALDASGKTHINTYSLHLPGH